MNFFTQDSLFLLYITGLFFIAFIRYTNFSYIKNNFISLINYNKSLQIQNSDINKKSLTGIFLSLNFYLSAGIFSVYILSNFDLIPDHINRFLFFGGIILVIFILIYFNAGINLLSAYIFNIKNIAQEFNRNNQLIYHAYGILLLISDILISFSSFSNTAFYAGIAITGIFYLLRIFRFIKINLSKHMNSFYLFLYLCTVEILPMIYLIKFLTFTYNSTD